MFPLNCGAKIGKYFKTTSICDKKVKKNFI